MTPEVQVEGGNGGQREAEGVGSFFRIRSLIRLWETVAADPAARSLPLKLRTWREKNLSPLLSRTPLATIHGGGGTLRAVGRLRAGRLRTGGLEKRKFPAAVMKVLQDVLESRHSHRTSDAGGDPRQRRGRSEHNQNAHAAGVGTLTGCSRSKWSAPNVPESPGMSRRRKIQFV